MSEQYVNTIAQVATNTVSANLTVATVMAALLGGPKSPLSEWLDAGNEIDTDIKIPRVYADKFAADCRDEGIPFQFIEKGAVTEYVTVATRGPGAHVVNKFGEFEYDANGRRAVDKLSNTMGDREAVTIIANKWNNIYAKAIQTDYRLTPERADKRFIKEDKKTGEVGPVETMQVSGLNYEEAKLLQDMAARNLLYSYIRSDFGDGYSVEFYEGDAVNSSITGLSPVELSVQQMLMAEARPEVKEWMEISHKNEMDIEHYMHDLKETHEAKSMYIVALGQNSSSFDEYKEGTFNRLIKIEDNHAYLMETHVGAKPSIKNFNLNTEKGIQSFEKALHDFDEDKLMLKPEVFEAAQNNLADFNKYIDVYEKIANDWADGVAEAAYEAEKLAEQDVWQTKFKQTFSKDLDPDGNKAITRTIETRIPDSDTLITFLEKDTSGMSTAAANQHLYSTIAENVNRRAALLHITTGQKYVTAINTDKTYGPQIEVDLQEEAKKQDFDLRHATEEERAEFYNDYVEEINKINEEFEIDLDHDGIDDREDNFIDLDGDGIDDRDEGFEPEL